MTESESRKQRVTLTMAQVKGAQLLASGMDGRRTCAELGIAESTLSGWRANRVFQECLAFSRAERIKTEARISAETGAADELDAALKDEIELKAAVRPLALELCAMTTELVNRTRSECEELSPRMIPQMMQAVSSAIALLRTGNDRLAGLEGVLDELAKIEKSLLEGRAGTD